MQYTNQRLTPSSDLISAEFHFLMDEYFTALGCAPPIRCLVAMPAMAAVALLAQAILLKRPIDDFAVRARD